MFRPGDKVLISHGGYCGRCFSCLNCLSQAHCAGLVEGERAGLSTTAPEFFVNGLAPVERKNDSQSGWAALAEEVQQMWDEVATHEFPMAEIDKALELTSTRKNGKVLIYPGR